MTKRIGGFRRKTSHKLRKKNKEKGRISITRYFQDFKEGDKVSLAANPTVQKGMYHPRFHSKIGVVKSMRGKCYQIRIMDKKKEKTVIVHPVHLRRIK